LCVYIHIHNVYENVYVYMMYVHIHIHVCIYIYIYVHVYMSIHIYIYIYDRDINPVTFVCGTRHILNEIARFQFRIVSISITHELSSFGGSKPCLFTFVLRCHLCMCVCVRECMCVSYMCVCDLTCVRTHALKLSSSVDLCVTSLVSKCDCICVCVCI